MDRAPDRAAVANPSENFLQRLARSVGEKPEDRVFARWYSGKAEVESVHTFKGLWAASGEIAHLLRVTWGLEKGDRVVLAFNFGLRFFAVFLGCLRAGVIAVPVYPPNPATLKKSLRKLELIVQSCEPKMILVCPLVNKLRLASKLRALATGDSGWPDLPYNCPDVRQESLRLAGGEGGANFSFADFLGGGQRKSFDEPDIKPDDVAFLQFTSGSTSDPKGVMLTFRNLEHNIACVVQANNEEIAARGGAPGVRRWFSWLPTFHDMGLIQGTLVPFVAGWSAGYCSPISFMRTPLIWLQLMSKEKAQMTAAPDFAYRLCVRKWKEMTPQAQAALNLDLSHTMFMQNAAEPIHVSTVRDFARTFAPVGLPAYAPNTAYGLAEHTVGCNSYSPNRAGQDLDSIPDTTLLICGDVNFTDRWGMIKIVDPETRREVPPGETGELWVHSPSVGKGYWGKPELSRETFRAKMEFEDGRAPAWAHRRFLRTGDLCRVDADGFLFIEGRQKDLIIVAGRNIYPQDIEFAAQESSAYLRPGCIAAFSEVELGGDIEIVTEVRKAYEADPKAIREALEAVRRSVISEAGLCPSRVVAIRERSIPKTTSGKIQRRATRKMLHDGELQVVQELSGADSLPPPPPRPTPADNDHDGNRHRHHLPRPAEGSAAAATAAVPPVASVVQSAGPPPGAAAAAAAAEPAKHYGGGGDVPRPPALPWQRSTPSPASSSHTSLTSAPAAAPTAVHADSPPVASSIPAVSSDGEPEGRSGDARGGREGATGQEKLKEAIELVNSTSRHGGARSGRQAFRAADVIRIVETATGIEGLEADDDLLELGVDSAVSVEISSELAEVSGLELPPEMVFTHPTPALIAEYVNSRRQSEGQDRQGGEFSSPAYGKEAQQQLLSQYADPWFCEGSERLRQKGEEWTMGPMRSWRFRIIQVVVMVIVLAQVFVSIGAAILATRDVELAVLGSDTYASASEKSVGVYVFEVLIVAVAWFLFYSAMVIAAKWLVLGEQHPARVPLSSRSYLCWWYANSMLTVWEAFGGWWLLDTRLIILFYRLMGAKISWSASICVFLREHDLLEIGRDARVYGNLYARRFEASFVALLPIVVGRGAEIKRGSVVYGGTHVGRMCTVQPLSVVAPCSRLEPHSVWEGHPAKLVDDRHGDSAGHGLSHLRYSSTDGGPCISAVGPLLVELAKILMIVGTLSCIVLMAFISTKAYVLIGLGALSFRYALLLEVAAVVAAVSTQLAIFTIALKWIFAGCVKEGTYRPNAFRYLRRWFLGKLHTLVNAYFLTFNRLPRRDWWGSSLGMQVGRGSIVLCMATYNPEDAHLIRIGEGSHVSHPLLGVDDATDNGNPNERVKRRVTIGSNTVIGYGSYLGAGSTVNRRSMLAGYSMLRPGEELPEGSVTMSDSQNSFRMDVRAPFSSPATVAAGVAETDSLLHHSSAAEVHWIDLTCTVGALVLNALSLIGAFEAVQLVLYLWPTDEDVDEHKEEEGGPGDLGGIKGVLLGTVAVAAWAFVTSMLLFVYKYVFVGDLAGAGTASADTGKRVGTAAAASVHPTDNDEDAENILESGTRTPSDDVSVGHQQRQEQRRVTRTLTAAELMRWRWMQRVLSYSLFEPYFIEAFLKGTWLLNAWLNLMGAEVSMGSLILGKVSDHGLVQVCDGAVVAGVLYGHRITFVNGRWSMEMAPATIGERAVVHAHCTSWSADLQPRSTLTSVSATLSKQVLKAGEVYGGRPPRKLNRSAWPV